MQPTLDKPVMDVAAPKSPAHNPFAQPNALAAHAAPAADLPVRPAPFAPQAPLAVAPARQLSHGHTSAGRPASRAPAASHAPVALITVTVFVMLVLSALAVTVYVTTKTA